MQTLPVLRGHSSVSNLVSIFINIDEHLMKGLVAFLLDCTGRGYSSFFASSRDITLSLWSYFGAECVLH